MGILWNVKQHENNRKSVIKLPFGKIAIHYQITIFATITSLFASFTDWHMVELVL